MRLTDDQLSNFLIDSVSAECGMVEIDYGCLFRAERQLLGGGGNFVGQRPY